MGKTFFQRISSEDKKILFFLTKFFLIYFVFLAIIENIDLSFFNNFLAELTANFFGLAFFENIIFVGTQPFVVTNLCTGLVSSAILGAVIFALKKPNLKHKIVFYVVGSVLLLIVNISRILLVLYSSMIGFDAEIVHILTWFVMSGTIIIIWFLWTKRILKYKKIGELL